MYTVQVRSLSRDGVRWLFGRQTEGEAPDVVKLPKRIDEIQSLGGYFHRLPRNILTYFKLLN